MIALTKLDGKEMVLNCDQILTIERTPDTLLTLATGDHFLVKDTVEEVIAKTVAFRRRYMTPEGAAGLGG